MNPSPPKSPTPIFFWKAMPIETPLAAQSKGVLLADELAAQLAQVHREDLAGVRRGEGHPFLPAGVVGEHRHEQALAGEQAFPGAEQLVHEPALRGLAAVPEHRLHGDAAVHVHHPSRFRDRALAGVELDLDVLHLDPRDAVVDLVGDAARRNRQHGAGFLRKVRAKPRDISEGGPVGHAGGIDQGRFVGVAVPDVLGQIRLRQRADLLPVQGLVPLLVRHRFSPRRPAAGAARRDWGSAGTCYSGRPRSHQGRPRPAPAPVGTVWGYAKGGVAVPAGRGRNGRQ